MSMQIDKKVLREKNNQLNDSNSSRANDSKTDDKESVDKKNKKEKNVFTYMESTCNIYLFFCRFFRWDILYHLYK